MHLRDNTYLEEYRYSSCSCTFYILFVASCIGRHIHTLYIYMYIYIDIYIYIHILYIIHISIYIYMYIYNAAHIYMLHTSKYMEVMAQNPSSLTSKRHVTSLYIMGVTFLQRDRQKPDRIGCFSTSFWRSYPSHPARKLNFARPKMRPHSA